MTIPVIQLSAVSRKPRLHLSHPPPATARPDGYQCLLPPNNGTRIARTTTVPPPLLLAASHPSIQTCDAASRTAPAKRATPRRPGRIGTAPPLPPPHLDPRGICLRFPFYFSSVSAPRVRQHSKPATDESGRPGGARRTMHALAATRARADVARRRAAGRTTRRL
jgi:hypothetical protein